MRIKHTFRSLVAMPDWLTVVLKAIGVGAASASAFFGHIYDFLLLTGVLVGIDFITGAWMAVKSGQKFSSSGMKRTVEKTVLYCIAIVATYLVEQVFISDYAGDARFGITYLCAGFIAATELQSILENVGKLTGIDIWGRIKDTVLGWFTKKA